MRAPLWIAVLAVGLWLATQPSYIHPDEHFQSIEVLLSVLLNRHGANIPWEFQPDNAARSFVPLYILYGPTLFLYKYTSQYISSFTLLKILRINNALLYLLTISWFYQGNSSLFAVYTSYITWSLQSHTFSNSFETVLLLIVIKLYSKLYHTKRKYQRLTDHIILGTAIAFGTFNRITFPAFIIFPTLKILFRTNVFLITTFFALTSLFCIMCDTFLYNTGSTVIAPLNNFLYNLDESNLASHGIHSRLTHILVNMPQLLGPLIFTLDFRKKNLTNFSWLTIASGLFALSLFKHQELRFLMPLVPFFFLVINSEKFFSNKMMVLLWLFFNLMMAILMGGLHQSGVIKILQIFQQDENSSLSSMGVHIWWKTYSPPTWLYDNNNLTISTLENGLDQFQNVTHDHIIDLKGSNAETLSAVLKIFIIDKNTTVQLFMPDSVISALAKEDFYKLYNFTKKYHTKQHLDLDHFDFQDKSTFQLGLTCFDISSI